VTSAADCRRSVGPNTRRMPHLPGIPKTHFKTRVRMHALAELFPFPELPGVGCLLMEGYSSAISRVRDR
jgi:hypothetical protein